MRHLLTLLALVLSATFAQAGENWPQYRGPNGDGHADAHNLPVKWSETENVKWKTAIHDKGWSSPVIWGDQIWMTTALADGKQLFALCVDRNSGKIIHDLKVFDVEKPQFCIEFNSYASSTPIIEAGRVYVHFGSPGTACLDTTTGKTIWERRDLPCDHWRGAGSSPIIYGDLLILIFDGHDFQYVVALNKNTGKTVWKTDRNAKYKSDDGDIKKAYATPQVIEVDGKPQLICPSAEVTVAYNPADGTELWRLTHGGMNAAARPLYAHGLLYLTSGHTAKLLAVKPAGVSGKEPPVEWSHSKGVPTRPSLLLIDDLLFMVNDNGIASCVEAKSGEQHWEERLKGKAACSASPIYADGHIYVASQDGPTFVIEPGKKFKLLGTNALDAGCMASPAAVGKSLFLRTRTHLYCIEEK
jgi:outer membrane protein assembly factor BamB